MSREEYPISQATEGRKIVCHLPHHRQCLLGNPARESQQEFKRAAQMEDVFEARELIIALPEVYTQYEPQEVLEDFTEEFHRRYGVECVSAPPPQQTQKTNYHIHLIFSERTLLPEPEVKIATQACSLWMKRQRVRTQERDHRGERPDTERLYHHKKVKF